VIGEDPKVRIQCTGFDLTTRTFLAAVLAIGLTMVTLSTSYAGVLPPPTPSPSPFCDMACSLDKKCSVGEGGWQDSCVVSWGEEVTYHYLVELYGGNATVEVTDDKLGLIGQSSGETLTRTATITETTTNNASMSLISIDPDCICLVWEPYDSVTVTVSNPTPTPTATATPVPTPTPILCSAVWPETQIITTAKGQSPTNNPKVTHAITGHIIDPGSLSQSAHRIQVCAGTRVTSRVTDTTGSPTNTAGGSLLCTAGACWGEINVTEKYQSISADGRDKDSITFIPK
jgi:hypothetical protein